MKRLAIVAIVLSLCGSAAAQSSGIPDSLLPAIAYLSVFDMSGGGARARGMGNAYIAAGNDATAITWNPAGIHDVDKTVMTFGVSMFKPRGQSFTGPVEAPQTGSYSGPGAFAFVSPFRMKGHGFVGGLSYTRISDEAFLNAYDFNFPIDPDGAAGIYDTTQFYGSFRDRYHAEMTPVTLGLGTRISDKVAAGLAINVLTGRSVERNGQHFWADNYLVFEYYPQKVQWDQNADVIDSSTFSGVNVVLGFKYEVEKFSLGIVGKLPYQLTQKTNRTIRVTTTVNGLERTNGTFVQYKDNNISRIAIPIQVGVGGAFKPNTKTTMALDVEIKPFSGKKIIIRDTLRLIPGAKDEEVTHEFDPEWRNVIAFRAGAEHLLTTKSALFPTVPLRAGFGIVPIPDPNRERAIIDLNGDIHGVPTSTASGLNLSLGTGVYWTQIRLDLAYTFRSYTRTVGLVKSDSRDHLFQLTFTGYF